MHSFAMEGTVSVTGCPNGGTDNASIDSYLKPEVNKTFSTSPIYLQHQKDVRVMH